MLAFMLTAENAQLFFEICQEVNAQTEEERTAVLVHMARLGCVKNVIETKQTKEEYVKHLAKNFKVLMLEDNKNV